MNHKSVLLNYCKTHDFVIISWSCWCFVLLSLGSFLHRRYSHLARLTELGSRRSIVAHGAAAGKWFPSEACSSWRGEFGTRIHQNSGRARVSKCFKSPWHWVNDTAFGKVFLPNCPFKLYFGQAKISIKTVGASTSLARRRFFFFRQIGWKIWRLGVWADAKQVPFMATCASVTPQCCFFFSQGWRSSMAWIAQAGGWTEEIPNSHPGMVDKTLWIYNGTQVYLPNFNWSSTGEPDFWTIDSRWARNCGKDWLLGSLGVFWDFQMDFRHRLCVDQAFCWKACFAGSESM